MVTREELEVKLKQALVAESYWDAAIIKELLHANNESQTLIETAHDIHDMAREWVVDTLHEILGDEFLERY